MTAREKVLDVIRNFEFERYDKTIQFSWVDDLADAILDALGSRKEHIAEVGHAGRWIIQHPLDCRDDLFKCPFNEALAKVDTIPGPGRYPVFLGRKGFVAFGEQL